MKRLVCLIRGHYWGLWFASGLRLKAKGTVIIGHATCFRCGRRFVGEAKDLPR